jgi:zinc/manganese transport system substrate-binding protein
MTIGAAAQDAKVSVVAVENFYGDIARQIGGDRVDVACSAIWPLRLD